MPSYETPAAAARKALPGDRKQNVALSRFNGSPRDTRKEIDMRAILLWLLGIPIPVIILLYLFGVFS
ncbi:hypothetical protein [Ferrovibrio sp.]|jgi:hypothetical protein|uniref:hypothetical protein n=1 Tax=Ferrovibrio sp. TaxID=1917215 RepID=UPI0035B1102F